MSNTSVAQRSEYILTRFGEKTLIQSGIEDVMFDEKGFLWMATQMGIIRYDGYDFREYNKMNSKEISCSRFVYISQEGVLFGEDGSTYRTDKKNKIPLQCINSINLFRNQPFTNKKKEAAFIKKYPFVVSIKRDRKTEKDLRNNFLYPINAEAGYLYWRHSLTSYYKGKTTTQSIGFLNPAKCETVGNYFFFSEVNAKRVCIYSPTRKIDLTTLLCGDVPLDEVNKKETFLFRSKSNVYFLIVGKCLYRLYPQGKKFFACLIVDKLDIPNITCLDYYPKSEVYAIGSFSNGLCILKRNNFKSYYVAGNQTNPITYATISLNENEILLSNGYTFNRETKEYRKVIPLNDNARAFCIDSRKRIWYAEKSILQCYTIDFKHVCEFDLNKLEPDFNIVNKIAEDPYGNLWFNTGSQLHSIVNGSVIRNRVKLPPFRQGEYIETFDFITRSTIWVATSKKLLKIDLRSGETKVLLKKVDVRTLYRDRDGDYWIGTYGDGIFLYKNQHIYRVPLDNRRYLICSHSFILDGFRNLWISSNKGLFVIKKKDLIKSLYKKEKYCSNYSWYTSEDGLPGNEFNGGCYPNSYVWNNQLLVPSMGGLISFSPNDFINDSHKLELVINSIDCDGKKITGKPLLSPDFNRLSIDYSIPFWKKKENIRISYKINSSDNPIWLDVSLGNPIQISNLSFGNYRITIRIIDPINKTILYKHIAFSVSPYPYQTAIFRFFVILALIGLIGLLYRMRLRFLIRERKMLQMQVANQIQELFDSNQDLEFALFKLKEINNKLEFSNTIRAKLVSIFIHDLKSPMHFLSKVTQKISEDANALSKDEFRALTDDLHTYSKSIIQYIDHFLIWQSVNQDNLKVNFVKVQMITLVREVTDTYEGICKKNENQISVNCPEDIALITDPELLKIILRNLIDNANKHTFGGTIKVDSTIKDQSVYITVSDNGDGLNKVEIDQLYEIMNQDLLGKSHQNIGYQIIGNFVKVLSAEIYIISEGKNRGTQIKLLLPL